MSEDKKGKLIGYARTSRKDQCLDLQIDALIEYGVDKKNLFWEQESALSPKRLQFDLALKRCRRGDTLVSWKLDRIGRSVPQIISIVTDLKERGVGYKSLTEQWDTATPSGKLMFTLSAALTELERDLTIERTKEGLVAAKKRGTYTTRKITFSWVAWNRAVVLYKRHFVTEWKEIARRSHLNYQTVLRNKKYIEAGWSFDRRFPYEKNRKKKEKSND